MTNLLLVILNYSHVSDVTYGTLRYRHLYDPREREFYSTVKTYYQSKTDSLIASIFQTTIHMYLFMIRVMFV